MAAPLYVGMPPTEREFVVPRPVDPKPWGKIICGGACRDDYSRIEIYHQDAQHYVKLQRAALRSLQAAEDAIGDKIWLTGSWRSCSLQSELYASDSHRYAAPSTTAHCRGLAIDVSQNQTKGKLDKIHKALTYRHWHQARPTDEPWHYSLGVQV